MTEYLLKEIKRLRWRSKKWLIFVLALELVLICPLILLNNFSPWLLLTLVFTYLIWILINNYDILLPHHKMAIVLEVDEDNLEAISKARRIVDKIESHFNLNSNYSKLIRIYPLDVNRFKTVEESDNYLKSWWNKFDSIILAEIDYGFSQGREVFQIKSFSIISKYLTDTIEINSVKIDLKSEVNLVALSSRLHYLKENELLERELVISSLIRLLLFYSGLCLICQQRIKDAQRVFKSIYNPESTLIIVDPTAKDKKINLTPEQIFHGRLKTLLTEIYKQIIDPIQYSEGDQWKLNTLNDAIATLNPAPIVFPLKVILARTYYELGNREKAEQTTEEIFTEYGLREEVFLNRGFFAILDNNPNKVLKNYKQLGNRRDDGISIIAFLHEEMERCDGDKMLFQFALAITTLLYQDKNDGKFLLRDFIGKTQLIHRLKPLRDHCIHLLTNS